MRFTCKTTTIKSKAPYWNTLLVEIFDQGVKIGEYKRNYSSMYNTFVPFEKDGKWYALYSKDYTATRIMSLPDCKDLGGEDPHGFGFCPVDYYVPRYYIYRDDKMEFRIYENEEEEDLPEGQQWIYEGYALLAGCVWGDDTSWKLQYIDLSQCDKGIIERTDKFGYMELYGDTILSSVTVDEDSITVAEKRFLRLDDKQEDI